MVNFDELRKSIKDDEDFDFEEWEEQNLYELEQKVYDDFDIWIEPSTQCGMGGIWIYSNEDDETIVAGYDYQTFVQCIEDIALKCNTDEEFISEFKQYIRGLIEE